MSNKSGDLRFSRGKIFILKLMESLQKEGQINLENHVDIQDYFQLVRACKAFFDDYDLSMGSKLMFRKGKEAIPFNNLSMGQKQLLLVLLKVTNTQKRPAIFIMDEPDLGMHVDWKKKLIKEIKASLFSVTVNLLWHILLSLVQEQYF